MARKNSYKSYYATLRKPSWAPPARVFGPVWALLYLLIVVSFGTVFMGVFQNQIPPIVLLPLVLNLAANLSFTWIQFALRNNFLAALDSVVILGTLKWSMWLAYPYTPLAVWVLVPYLLWIAFALILQISITYLNRTV